jgi:hypothetical protein
MMANHWHHTEQFRQHLIEEIRAGAKQVAGIKVE